MKGYGMILVDIDKLLGVNFFNDFIILILLENVYFF